jgi:hypothetical protein
VSFTLWLEGSDVDSPEVGNITYNVDPMFALALSGDGSTAGCWTGADVVFHLNTPAMKRFLGRRAGDCIEPLRAACAHMASHPSTYAKLNPDNGWGDSDSALLYLVHFLRACEGSPDSIIGGSF